MKKASRTKATGAGVLATAVAVALVIGPLLFFVCLTMFRLAGTPENNTGQTAVDDASAVIKTCDRRGPVSSEGFGYFWECDAEVTVNGHSLGVVEFDPDELTPVDGTNVVGVQRSGDHWQRDVAHPYRLLHVAGLVILAADFLAVLAALIPLLVSVLWVFARLRRRKAPETVASWEEGQQVIVRLKAPPKPKRRSPAGATVLGFSGLFSLLIGVWMFYIHGRLSGDLWGFAAALSIVLLGIGFTAAAAWWAFAPDKPGDVRTIELTEAGIRQQGDSSEPLVLPWKDLRSVVFDERGRPGWISVHLALAGEASREKLLEEYRRPSKHGVLLTPEIELEEAESASEAIEGFCPGLVHWRSRELSRSGFGPGGSSGSRLVRWKDGVSATQRVEASPADEPVRIRSGRMPGARILGFAGLYALIVLLFVLRQSADSVPVWLSPVVVLATVVCGVVLHKTRFRGTSGFLEVDEDSLTWFERDTPPRHVVPREIPPVDVLLSSLQEIRFERVPSEHGRRYVRVSVRTDGVRSVLAEKITAAAAARLKETLKARSAFAGDVALDQSTGTPV
ncbi:DUF6346 domain-containing protein [Amycolatopsis sp. EV170708-02-1]|uniref:DUF6346 domain-containing protein n=1 Tax=Amycolatopsis sp. EV170708-02-1 TaxID=2919322 RepID=UPI001F0BE164|nr:DUF6346 domain-containing protein [Amycolatopsis sp. EV170708-02-1]UMP02869.1 DUF6346 domain-containing protein [Amycolatopsis sp. EV170708-02-1]